MTKLPKSLQGRPFTYSEASSCGLTQYSLRQLLVAESIERIERGIYQAAGVDLSEEELYRRAVKRTGEPSAVCLLSALSHYDLTDTIPKIVWLMVPAGKRTTSLNVKLYRARDPKWNIGIIKGQGYSITTIERTLVDSLTHKSLLASRVGLDALKRAIAEKRTTASKVMEMSVALGVQHRVLSYIEVLS